MKTYTVIGFWTDSDTRWSGYYEANSYEEAENKALEEHGEGLVIVATIEGKHRVDSFITVRYAL